MSKKFSFNLKKTNSNSNARRGELHTAHGTIQTPAFMPVGTCATVKAMKNEDVIKSGAEIILGNTYHLMLRPGADRIEKLGGLHKFMNWNKPILTDSGGFQVMSLSSLRKIDDNGVTFSSHIDGKKHFLTPEYCMEIQHKLDSNITMVLDECIAYPATKEQAKEAMERSLRWAERSKKAYIQRDGYGLFAIIQGEVDEELSGYASYQLSGGIDSVAMSSFDKKDYLEKVDISRIKFIPKGFEFLPSKTPHSCGHELLQEKDKIHHSPSIPSSGSDMHL